MKPSLTYALASLAILAAGCGQPDRTVRHYREINFTADGAGPASAPVAAAPAPAAGQARMPDLPPELQTPALPLEWDTPAGWEDLGPSGMRITTLVTEGQECTMLSFPGDVGGDAANIRRWMGMIQQSISEERLESLVANPTRLITAGGLSARLFDFADVLPENAPMGTLAGIIPAGDHTIFVKLTGAAPVLARQKEAFEQLCRSIRLRPEAP